MTHTQLEGLVDALMAYRRWEGPADAFLKQFFFERKALGQQDRAFISDALYAGFRRHRQLSAWAPSEAPREQALLILTRFCGISLRDLGPHCRASDLEWLKTMKAEAREPSEALGVRAELPDWVIERLRPFLLEDEILALGRSLQEPAPLDLRVNLLKARRSDVLAALKAEGVVAKETPHSPWGLRVQGKPALQGSSIFREGFFEVQEEGSQLLGLLVAPRRGEMVVDFCAGAGGKTLLLGAMMQNEGRLYAFDVSEKRLQNLKPRLKRSGLSNVNPVLITNENDARVKRLRSKIDRVLVDAPCTGLGTLRRNPDLKLRQSEATLQDLLALQARILNAAAELVKPGGILVYATCSLLFEENEQQAAQFSQTHAEFETIDVAGLLHDLKVDLPMGTVLRLLPHRHATDGFFAAVWRRRRG